MDVCVYVGVCVWVCVCVSACVYVRSGSRASRRVRNKTEIIQDTRKWAGVGLGGGGARRPRQVWLSESPGRGYSYSCHRSGPGATRRDSILARVGLSSQYGHVARIETWPNVFNEVIND